MAFLYLDPMADRRPAPSQSEMERGRLRLLEAGSGANLEEAFAAFGLRTALPTDARIARAVIEVERRPDRFRRMSEAAEIACLSPSRFRARFRAEVGLPFRRYRMWRRMALVMRAIGDGGNLTDAALKAGFSSSAHLSTAFKQMFGLSPSEVVALGVRIDSSEDIVARRV